MKSNEFPTAAELLKAVHARLESARTGEPKTVLVPGITYAHKYMPEIKACRFYSWSAEREVNGKRERDVLEVDAVVLALLYQETFGYLHAVSKRAASATDPADKSLLTQIVSRLAFDLVSMEVFMEKNPLV